MLVDVKILSVIHYRLHTDLRLIQKRLYRQRVNFTFHWNELISRCIYDLDYVLLWTSRRSSGRPDMHNFIIRSADMSRFPYDITKSLEFVLLNLDIQTRTERVSVYCRSHCFFLSRLIMNLIFISTTEIMNQSDGSTDLINIILLWHVTSDRVRTYSSRYMTSPLNLKRGCRQSYSFSSRYILKSSDIWMTTSFCSYDFSSTLSLFETISHHLKRSIWRQISHTFPLLFCPLLCRL